MFRKIEKQFKSEDFKKEWNPLEYYATMDILKNKFRKHYKIYNIEDKFGLPYTSSSSFAMISNTNTIFEIEKGLNLEYFVITNNSMIIAVFEDQNNNERFYEIEF